MAIADVTRAKKEGETTGLSRVIIDGETEQLFGATMFGIAGAEVIAVLSNYMAMGASYRYMQQASQPYFAGTGQGSDPRWSIRPGTCT